MKLLNYVPAGNDELRCMALVQNSQWSNCQMVESIASEETSQDHNLLMQTH